MSTTRRANLFESTVFPVETIELDGVPESFLRGGRHLFELLPRALAAKDPAARQILEETAEDLALALSHITHLFHPEVIVLGGGLSLVGQPLRAAVAKALPRFVMNAFRAGPRVRLAALGEDAVPVGCLLGARLQFNL